MAEEKNTKTIFGHRKSSISGMIDDLALAGLSVDDIAKELDVKVGRVKGHINHIVKDIKDVPEESMMLIRKLSTVKGKVEESNAPEVESIEDVTEDVEPTEEELMKDLEVK